MKYNNWVAWVVAGTLVMAALILGISLAQETKEVGKVSPTPITTQEKVKNLPTMYIDPEINFSKTGNWSNGNLIYEEIGKPALMAKILFDDRSRCNDNVCIATDYSNGTRITIEGVLKDKILKVRKLTIND